MLYVFLNFVSVKSVVMRAHRRQHHTWSRRLEDCEEADDHCEEGDTFDEGGCDNHGGTDGTGSLGLTGYTFHGTLTNLTDTETGTDCGQTCTNTCTENANEFSGIRSNFQ